MLRNGWRERGSSRTVWLKPWAPWVDCGQTRPDRTKDSTFFGYPAGFDLYLNRSRATRQVVLTLSVVRLGSYKIFPLFSEITP